MDFLHISPGILYKYGDNGVQHEKCNKLDFKLNETWRHKHIHTHRIKHNKLYSTKQTEQSLYFCQSFRQLEKEKAKPEYNKSKLLFSK